MTGNNEKSEAGNGPLPPARSGGVSVGAGTDRAPVRVMMGSHVLLVESTGAGGTLRLLGPDGAQPLEVVIGPAGPVLHLRAGLTVAVDGQLSLRADAISLQAQTAVDVSSAGSVSVRAEGDLVSEARAQVIQARAGDVRVTANDDVVMAGERIKLNC